MLSLLVNSRKAVVMIALALAPAFGVAQTSNISSAADHPQVEFVSETQLSERLTELTVFSPSMEREFSLSVLVPEGFDQQSEPLPVLWLLHGGGGNHETWPNRGVQEMTEEMDLIVVMPDGGLASWYSDWVQTTRQGPQMWETYLLYELRPWIEERYQTRLDRSGRAIAGHSMGGYGAMYFASRRPDLFGFAASLAGALDNLHPRSPEEAVASGGSSIQAVTHGTVFGQGGDPGSLWGDPILDGARWRAHNPVELAENLSNLRLHINSGDGQGRAGPDPLDPDFVEMGCFVAAQTMSKRLSELEIDHDFVDLGPVRHNSEGSVIKLATVLPDIVAYTSEVRPEPTEFDYVAFEPSYSVWGWSVALDRPVLERSWLTSSPDGFTLTGTGNGTIYNTVELRSGPTRRPRGN